MAKREDQIIRLQVPKSIYDFEVCETLEELKACLHCINSNGLILAAVTQDAHGSYTVFFRRFAYG